MRLKSVELVGFKSFLEPTTISFAAGITAVVGPNGCGKSNVVDAIRWVLGEQAPSRLRGKSAEDLLFAGNEAHPAAGMAEVSLVLEADEAGPFPQPYSTLSEIAVTRRVFRSGDSEYLLNRIPCRLKDITEFFMAAQIHSRSFAIIEQGRVEEIIQAKPDEIRGMIEEAAGLALFKSRREMSERKLERVRENLARVADVLSEIERQLGCARRQAKKAEAYRLIRAELAELERLSAARRILGLRAEFAVESGREAELSARAESMRTALDGLKAALERAALAAQSAEAEFSSARRELESVHAAAAERARTRDFFTRRLDAIEQSEPAGVARLAELEAAATLARAARAQAGAAFARASHAGGGGEAELGELKRCYAWAQAALKDAERRAEELKDELSEVVREAAGARGRLADLTGEQAELKERAARYEGEAPASAEAAVHAASAARAADEGLARTRTELEALEGAYRDAAGGEIEAHGAAEHLAARCAALREALSAARAGVEAALAARDGSRRLKTVLEAFNGDRPSVAPEILGNVLNAPAELGPALAAVLGEELEAIIVESPGFAVRAIEILKEKNGGRLSFIPEPVGGGAALAQQAFQAPGVAGRLVDMIAVDPRFRPVAELMLGHVMVAEDVRSALAASNLNGHGAIFVTREGDVVCPGKVIKGGSAEGWEGAALNGSQPPLHETAQELERAEAGYETLKERLTRQSAVRERAALALGEARQCAVAAERAALAARAGDGAAREGARLAATRLADARRRAAEIDGLARSAQARLRELALAEQEMRGRLAALREETGLKRAAFEETGAAMLEAASRVEARRARLTALEQELRHAAETTRALETQIGESRTRRLRAREERAEFRAELEKLAAEDAEAAARETGLSEAIARLAAERSSRARELEERRAELERAEPELRAAEHEAVQCGFRRERAKALIEELLRSFAEKFAAEFDPAADELASALAARDAAADEERIAGLRAKAEKIGEVNLAAESEVQELEERAAQLAAERTDLEAAVKDLAQTITHLNREARRRFTGTFEGAARNFEQVLPKLLPGGKGRLDLAPAPDLLEAGVNVLVQPAGKKVKELALLSGGEKALSAMALIFSLFLLNPSPFCVMDEVDAPLDEFRLQAFTSLVAELKERSQFIVVTHNQRTMQKADQIHGITMDRPGVSRVISLRLPQAA